MIDFLTPLRDLATTLTEEAGVPASIDTDHLNPPCAWVSATEVRPLSRLGGQGEVTAQIDLIAPDMTTTQALAQLQTMLSACLQIVDPDGPIETDRFVQLRGGSQLPAFRIPVIIPF